MTQHVFNQALIALYVDVFSGEGALRQILHGLGDLFEVQAVSNIYKKQISQHKDDLHSELWVAMRVETVLGWAALSEALRRTPQRESKGWRGALLVAFNNVIQLSPETPLPSPALHSDPTLLRCAAEVWGHYEHPVLGQTLNELVKSNSSQELVEFFSQGQSLLEG